MRLHQLINSTNISESVEYIKIGRFSHPGIVINFNNVRFFVIIEYSNIIWKIAPGNKKKWVELKNNSNVNFIRDIAPLIEYAVYELLEYVRDIDGTTQPLSLRHAKLRPYNKYTLHGNTAKAAKLYQSFDNPPNGFQSIKSNLPRRRGINYVRTS